MFLKNFGAGPKWLPGKIVDVTGPVSFRVLLEIENGRNKQCHQNQLRARLVDDNSSEMSKIPEDESVPISITTATETADETMRQLSSPVQPEPTTQPLPSLLTLPTRQSQLAQEFLPLGDDAACCQPCPGEHRGLNVQSGMLEGHQDLHRA